MATISKKQLEKEAKAAGIKPELWIAWYQYNNFIFIRNKGDKAINYQWDGASHSIKGIKIEIDFVNNDYLELQIDKDENLELLSMRLFPFSENNASLMFVVMVSVVENYFKNI
ncbi:MAG: hypothetical protein JJE55_07005 [Flavobacteriaceae bacterium]|nr:hypothetical protein [Flavobacteriaceae bacterium]